MERQTKHCTYCGKLNPETVDHIPPVCLFPKPRPSDLVTVPCCFSCNKGSSKDDEYFKLTFVIRQDVGDQPAGQKLLSSTLRGLENPRKRGMLRALIRNMGRNAVHSPSGLYLGISPTFNVDLERLGRVTNRIVRGLFYKEFDRRLPESHDVQSFAESGLRHLNVDLLTTVRSMAGILKSGPPRMIGDGIFEYWYQATAEDSNTSVWLLRFFASESFLCLTASRNRKPPVPRPF